MSAKALKILGETEASINSSYNSSNVSRRGSFSDPPAPLQRRPSPELAPLQKSKSFATFRDRDARKHLKPRRTPPPPIPKRSPLRAPRDLEYSTGKILAVDLVEPTAEIDIGPDSMPTHTPSVSRLKRLVSRRSIVRSRSILVSPREATPPLPSPGRTMSARISSHSRKPSRQVREWFDRLEEKYSGIEAFDDFPADAKVEEKAKVSEAEDNFSLARDPSVDLTSSSRQHSESVISYELDSKEIQPPVKELDATPAKPKPAFSNPEALNILESSSAPAINHRREPAFPNVRSSGRTAGIPAPLPSPRSRRSSHCLGNSLRITSMLTVSDSDSEYEDENSQTSSRSQPAPTVSPAGRITKRQSKPKLRESSVYFDDSEDDEDYLAVLRELAPIKWHAGQRSRDSILSTVSNVWVPPTDVALRAQPRGPKGELSRKNVRGLGTQRYMAVTTEEAQLLESLRSKRAQMQDQWYAHALTASPDTLTPRSPAMPVELARIEENPAATLRSPQSTPAFSVAALAFPSPPRSRPTRGNSGRVVSACETTNTLIGSPALRGRSTPITTSIVEEEPGADGLEWPLRSKSIDTDDSLTGPRSGSVTSESTHALAARESDEIAGKERDSAAIETDEDSGEILLPRALSPNAAARDSRKELILPRLVSQDSSRLPSSVSSAESRSCSPMFAGRRTSRLQRAEGFVIRA